MSILRALRELSEAVFTVLAGKLVEFSREEELDGGFNLLGGEGVLLTEDHKSSCFVHDSLKQSSKDLIDLGNSFLRDAELRLDLFKDSEDVGLEGIAFSELEHSFLLLGKVNITWRLSLLGTCRDYCVACFRLLLPSYYKILYFQCFVLPLFPFSAGTWLRLAAALGA